MKRILFMSSLECEVYVIGYREQGESIIIFVKTDDKIVYSVVIDCYEYKNINLTKQILDNNNVKNINVLCWTHPHDDHTIGIDKILSQYTNEETIFLEPLLTDGIMDYFGASSEETYSKLIENLKSLKRKKYKVKTVCDNQRLEKICFVNGTDSYEFEIWSFAPDSNAIKEREARGTDKKANLYSIGLHIMLGEFSLVLAGDIENNLFINMPEYYLDVPIDYIKIPHHASNTSDKLLDIIQKNNENPPAVASCTVYRTGKLPKVDVIEKYKESGIEVFCSGEIVSGEDEKDYGIIKTSFDILKKRKYIIETTLEGNAIQV